MKKAFTFIIIPVLMFGLVFVCWNYYQNTLYNSTDKTIEFIQKHMNNKGDIIDYNDEIRVKSIEDIKLFVKKNQIKIEFGILALTWKPDVFETVETKNKLSRIGITMYRDKEDNLRVLWRNEEISRWVS